MVMGVRRFDLSFHRHGNAREHIRGDEPRRSRYIVDRCGRLAELGDGSRMRLCRRPLTILEPSAAKRYLFAYPATLHMAKKGRKQPIPTHVDEHSDGTHITKLENPKGLSEISSGTHSFFRRPQAIFRESCDRNRRDTLRESTSSLARAAA